MNGGSEAQDLLKNHEEEKLRKSPIFSEEGHSGRAKRQDLKVMIYGRKDNLGVIGPFDLIEEEENSNFYRGLASGVCR